MVERFHRQLKQSLKASESGKSWLEHLTWALLGLRAAHTKDATVTSVEVVFGSQMILPHQARTREVAGGVPQITLRQWSYVEVAGGKPSLLDGATHVYVHCAAGSSWRAARELLQHTLQFDEAQEENPAAQAGVSPGVGVS